MIWRENCWAFFYNKEWEGWNINSYWREVKTSKHLFQLASCNCTCTFGFIRSWADVCFVRCYGGNIPVARSLERKLFTSNYWVMKSTGNPNGNHFLKQKFVYIFYFLFKFFVYILIIIFVYILVCFIYFQNKYNFQFVLFIFFVMLAVLNLFFIHFCLCWQFLICFVYIFGYVDTFKCLFMFMFPIFFACVMFLFLILINRIKVAELVETFSYSIAPCDRYLNW